MQTPGNLKNTYNAAPTMYERTNRAEDYSKNNTAVYPLLHKKRALPATLGSTLAA